MSNPAAPREYGTGDILTAAVDVNLNRTEPATTEPLQYVVSDNSSTDQDHNGKDSDPHKYIDTEKESPTPARRYTTQSSAYSNITSDDDDDGASNTTKKSTRRKRWYQRGLNPLKWESPPPVPKERTVSREYGASFLSRLTFQWMSPAMAVRFALPHPFTIHLPFQSDVFVHSSPFLRFFADNRLAT